MPNPGSHFLFNRRLLWNSSRASHVTCWGPNTHNPLLSIPFPLSSLAGNRNRGPTYEPSPTLCALMHYWRTLGKYLKQMAADSMAKKNKKSPSPSQISLSNSKSLLFSSLRVIIQSLTTHYWEGRISSVTDLCFDHTLETQSLFQPPFKWSPSSVIRIPEISFALYSVRQKEETSDKRYARHIKDKTVAEGQELNT